MANVAVCLAHDQKARVDRVGRWRHRKPLTEGAADQ